MGIKVKVGDVFLVPIDEQRNGIGQLAGDWKGELYVVIYDKIVGSGASVNDIAGEKLLFAALTLDAKLFHGDWPIIGNERSILEAIPQPWFKIHQGSDIYVEPRDRSATRKATASEINKLRLRTVVAPVRLENALKALHGIGDWNSRYDDLRADYAIESEKLVAA